MQSQIEGVGEPSDIEYKIAAFGREDWEDAEAESESSREVAVRPNYEVPCDDDREEVDQDVDDEAD